MLLLLDKWSTFVNFMILRVVYPKAKSINIGTKFIFPWNRFAWSLSYSKISAVFFFYCENTSLFFILFFIVIFTAVFRGRMTRTRPFQRKKELLEFKYLSKIYVWEYIKFIFISWIITKKILQCLECIIPSSYLKKETEIGFTISAIIFFIFRIFNWPTYMSWAM